MMLGFLVPHVAENDGYWLALRIEASNPSRVSLPLGGRGSTRRVTQLTPSMRLHDATLTPLPSGFPVTGTRQLARKDEDTPGS